jgi:hypothetical protein
MKKRIFICCLFLVLLFNCAHESVDSNAPTSTHELHELSSRTVTLKELPKIADFVSGYISNSNQRIANKSYAITAFGNVDLEVITEVVDLNGNANYTFAVVPNHFYKNSFFNLVVYHSSEADVIESYVVEYAMTEDFATSYSNGTKHLGQFTGSIKYYDTQAFLAMDQKSSSRTNNCEEDDTNDMDEEVTECEEIVVVDGQGDANDDDTNSGPDDDDSVDNSNSSGSTSTSDGSGNVSGGGGEMIKFCNFIGVYTMNCGGTNSNALHLASTCQGPDIATASFFNGYDCGGGNLVFDPVKSSGCGSTGTAAIIPVPFYKLSLALGLDAAESECLDEHCELKNQIYNYLNIHIDNDGDYEEEALNFANTVIDELTDTCEIDFEVDFFYKIIYTINKPCQKEIVKSVMSISTPLTNLINNTFGVSENVNVKFWNGDISAYDPSANAYTNPFYTGSSDDFIINIGLSNDFLDTGTDLSIVAVVLHELIHAYFISLYLQGLLDSNEMDYNSLLNSFISFYENATQDTFETWDNELHNAMNNFMSQIAQTIYQYAQENEMDVSLDYCVSLAWGTMLNTNLIEEMLTENQIAEANNIMLTEQTNTEYHESYPVKGTPCE